MKCFFAGAPAIGIIMIFLIVFPPNTVAGTDGVKIAAIYALSGDAVSSNHSSVLGVRNAVAQLNRQGGILGKMVDLLEIDNQSTPIGSRVAGEKAFQMGVNAIIGSNWSTHSLAIADIAQQHGIPMITNMSTHPEVTRKGGFIFRTCYTDDIQGKAMAHFARQYLKAETAVLLVNLNSDYGIMLSREFKKHFKAAGGQIPARLVYKSTSNRHDFQHLISRARQFSPQVVFIPGYMEAALIIKEMNEQKLKAIPLGGDGWEAQDFFKIVGQEMKTGYFCSHWSSRPTTKALEDYMAQRPSPEPLWAAEVLAVDAVNLLAHAMTNAGTTSDRLKIRDHLSRVKNFQGITGTISFDTNGDPAKDVVIMEIKKGTALFHSRYQPGPMDTPQP